MIANSEVKVKPLAGLKRVVQDKKRGSNNKRDILTNKQEEYRSFINVG
jgi:hypothetical protein